MLTTDQASTTTADLSMTVAGIRFERPILNASGTFYAPAFARMMAVSQCLGGLVTKTVTSQPSVGNRPARTVELPGIGMLNSIGLQNLGLLTCLADEIPGLSVYGLPVALSLSASSVAEFADMARTIAVHPHASAIHWLELNLSCPNVSAGGLHFGTDPGAVTEAVAAVKAHVSCPVFAKLTPNVTDIVAIGRAAVAGGADGLTAINTVMGLAINLNTRKPALPRAAAGYSGPGIRPIALHAVWQLHRALPDTPIIGVGGIESAEDIMTFVLAGASLVQVGTTCFRQPGVFTRLLGPLRVLCEGRPLREWVGAAHD